jgi:hypothetical protein
MLAFLLHKKLFLQYFDFYRGSTAWAPNLSASANLCACCSRALTILLWLHILKVPTPLLRVCQNQRVRPFLLNFPQIHGHIQCMYTTNLKVWFWLILLNANHLGNCSIRGLALKHPARSVANNYGVYIHSGSDLRLESCDVCSTSGCGIGIEGAQPLISKCRCAFVQRWSSEAPNRGSLRMWLEYLRRNWLISCLGAISRAYLWVLSL